MNSDLERLLSNFCGFTLQILGLESMLEMLLAW